MPTRCRSSAATSGRCTNSLAECARSAAGSRGPCRAGLRQRKLVESKSFKLYLNSFNQTKFNSWDEVQQTLERDLSACAQGNVTVSLYRLHELEGQPIAHFHGTCIDDQDIDVESYEFSTDYLENAAGGKVVDETLVSHLLKSNCLITHQPDWGSVQIQYRGSQIDREKLLRYRCHSVITTNSTSSAWNASSMTYSVSASPKS